MKKKYKVGESGKFGISCELSPESELEGTILIQMNNIVYNKTNTSENLKDFFHRIDLYFQLANIELGSLFSISDSAVIRYFDYMRKRTSSSSTSHEYSKLPGPAEFDEIDSRQIIRAEYALDSIWMILIPNSKLERVLLYDFGENIDSVILARNTCRNMFSELSRLIGVEKHPPNKY